jgi:AcrR family transcriptional regulator
MCPDSDLTEKRRQQIIEAAMKVFSEKGFEKARVDDIVSESGLSKGAVYWYFDSKDAIFQAAFDQFLDLDQQGLKMLIQQPGTVRQRMMDYLLIMVDTIAQNQSLLSLGYQFYAAAIRQHRLKHYFQRYYQIYSDLISQLLKDGIERGELKVIDEQVVATQLVAMIEGMFLLWFLYRQDFEPERFVRSLVDTVFDGLAVESES